MKLRFLPVVLVGLVAGLLATGLAAAQPAHAGWTPQHSGTTRQLNGVAFVGPQDGWAVGGQWYSRSGNVIVHTGDGGRHWLPETPSTSRPLLAVSFANARHGWAVGGATWTDPTNGALRYLSVIVWTNNGGRTWRVQKSGTNLPMTLYGVRFVTTRLGWAVGEFGGGNGDPPLGVVLVTRNGGTKWSVALRGSSSASAITAWGLSHLAAVDAHHVWVSGIGGSFLLSADGGAAWTPVTIPLSATLGADGSDEATAFANATSGWVVGTGAAANGSWCRVISHTSDGGHTWQAQKVLSGAAPTLSAVAAVDAHRVWVVGGSGLVLSSANGGRSWHAWTRRTHSDLTDVAFPTPTRGWAVGAKGVILRYAP